MTEVPLQNPAPAPGWDWQSLRRSAVDQKIAGICGGFGEHTPIPSWMWRVLFLATLFCGGMGLIAYVILWICMPPPVV